MKSLFRLYNRFFSGEKEFAEKVRNLTGLYPSNTNLYHQAFQHSSINGSVTSNNERLELLGDAVLDLIITDYLFSKYPYKPEGFLTKMRSKIVNRQQLNRVAYQMGIQEFLKTRSSQSGLRHSSVLGNSLEALIGAIYLDAGMKGTTNFVILRFLSPYFNLQELETVDLNFKSKLIEWAQQQNRQVVFDMIEEKSNKSNKMYKMGVFLDGKLISQSLGKSKKKAEQEAASIACELLEIK